jgi:hypothetical protein
MTGSYQAQKPKIGVETLHGPAHRVFGDGSPSLGDAVEGHRPYPAIFSRKRSDGFSIITCIT